MTELKREDNPQGVSEPMEVYNHLEDRRTIESLVLYLQAATKNGATHIEFICEVDEYHVDSIEIEPFKLVTESDESFEKRKATAKNHNDYQEKIKVEREKHELKRLKAIYE